MTRGAGGADRGSVRRRRVAAAALAAAWLGAADAARAASGCDDLSGAPINFGVDWQAEVKPILNEMLGGRCTSCHNSGSPAGGLDLSDDGVDAIYKIVNVQVEPGDPLGSVLFVKINCAVPDFGSRMPLAGVPLTFAEQGLIFDWIAQGALGEDPEDPIFRDYLFGDGAESLRFGRLPP